mmetsp:Transcript_27495/g.60503  ORF Transcript_27495/g.60503 Transcript_27495/m.60503 type:complete len:301 (-) Transcript_27495:173-1075(-)
MQDGGGRVVCSPPSPSRRQEEGGGPGCLRRDHQGDEAVQARAGRLARGGRGGPSQGPLAGRGGREALARSPARRLGGLVAVHHRLHGVRQGARPGGVRPGHEEAHQDAGGIPGPGARQDAPGRARRPLGGRLVVRRHLGDHDVQHQALRGPHRLRAQRLERVGAGAVHRQPGADSQEGGLAPGDVRREVVRVARRHDPAPGRHDGEQALHGRLSGLHGRPLVPLGQRPRVAGDPQLRQRLQHPCAPRRARGCSAGELRLQRRLRILAEELAAGEEGLVLPAREEGLPAGHAGRGARLDSP